MMRYMTNEELWQAVLAQIQLNISPANFSTWFKNTEINSLKRGEIIISTPNSFVKEWLENKYNKNILKILHSLDENIKEVKYIIGKTKPRVFNKIDVVLPENNQLEFQEFKIDKETNLNPRYNFDSFVVGPFNELPHAAAVAVAKDPGLVYNPLFIYGGVGLGKTHILQAIGNEVVKNFKKKKVRYVSSEKFTSEVVSAIKNYKIDNFKLKYKTTDVLIIDDIQFLAGREKTQEEFFNVFNVLYEGNKQIILSSDRPPKALQSLMERLRSRFEGGMIADISMPDYETRLAILKTKAQEKGVGFPEDVYQYIASVIKKNIRELEGVINRLIIYQKFNNQQPDLGTAKNLFKDLLSSPATIITPKKIIQTVAEFYDLKEKDILVSSRKKEIVRPRQIAMYLLREDLKNSFPFIGRKFDGKDHTTAIHSYKKVSLLLKKDKKIGEEIELIREKLLYNVI
ncbi:MAG: chromosomal replication initiator protein DnaA [Candidatus Nealsonbacteria bacterium]|nr:chromosomal replication initiator protein DnaA [Candidatus Nealsonbacteria bacterium]